MSVLLEQGVLQKLGDFYPLPINTKQFHEIIILYVEYSTRKAILKVAFPPFFRNLGGRSHSIRYIIVKLWNVIKLNPCHWEPVHGKVFQIGQADLGVNPLKH